MKVCEICQKGSQMGGVRKKLRGNYNPVNWLRKHPNLQKARLSDGRRVLACTSCIKITSKTAKAK